MLVCFSGDGPPTPLSCWFTKACPRLLEALCTGYDKSSGTLKDHRESVVIGVSSQQNKGAFYTALVRCKHIMD